MQTERWETDRGRRERRADRNEGDRQTEREDRETGG